MTELYGYLSALAYALTCVLVGVLVGKLGVPKPYTRKIIHISVGLEWGILYVFFGASLHTLAICALCLIFLAVAYLRGWFSSSMGSDADNAPGTVYYAVSMTLMAAVCLWDARFLLPFGVGVVCTSLGDGVAGVVGQLVRRHNPRIYRSKTLFGTLSMWISSAVGVAVFSHLLSMSLPWYAPVAIATLGTLLELLSVRGLDNVAVPLSTAALCYGFYVAPALVLGYLAPILLTPLILLIVLKGRLLTPWGVAAACVLDLVLSLTLGNAGFLLLLSFLVLGVLTDRIGRRYKRTVLTDEMQEQAHGRRAVQVLANAAVPAVLSVAFFISGHTPFLLATVATLAEALGDTAASGIGSLSHRVYDVFRRRPVKRGESGGVSLLGTLSALLGSAVLCLLARLFFPLTLTDLLLLVGVSFLGTVIDSALGSLVQGKFVCTVCGQPTEKRRHCGAEASCVGGVGAITNEAVNAISSAITACLSLLIFYLV